MTEKKLSLDHLLEGMKLAAQVHEGDISAMGKMVAIYLADADSLWKAKSNPEVFEVLEKQAVGLDHEEASEILGFFMKALTGFSTKLQNFAPQGSKKKQN